MASLTFGRSLYSPEPFYNRIFAFARIGRGLGWMVLHQQKTGNPVSIPIHPKLREGFQAVKVWPLNDDDRIFPDAKM